MGREHGKWWSSRTAALRDGQRPKSVETGAGFPVPVLQSSWRRQETSGAACERGTLASSGKGLVRSRDRGGPGARQFFNGKDSWTRRPADPEWPLCSRRERATAVKRPGRRPTREPLSLAARKDLAARAKYVGSCEHKVERWWGGYPKRVSYLGEGLEDTDDRRRRCVR